MTDEVTRMITDENETVVTVEKIETTAEGVYCSFFSTIYKTGHFEKINIWISLRFRLGQEVIVTSEEKEIEIEEKNEMKEIEERIEE